MSSFMFVASTEYIKSATTEELEQRLIKLESFLSTVKWDKLQQCTFYFDESYGKRASVHKIKQELENRKNGTDKSIEVMVPGYNPAIKKDSK